jgi:hypothetical protein
LYKHKNRIVMTPYPYRLFGLAAELPGVLDRI